jgi:hypothetical protein
VGIRLSVLDHADADLGGHPVLVFPPQGVAQVVSVRDENLLQRQGQEPVVIFYNSALMFSRQDILLKSLIILVALLLQTTMERGKYRINRHPCQRIAH